ncbi:hypothetical protein FQZ97_828870 [compost metagenome]
MGFAGIWFEHAVANETETNAGNHRQLADAPGDVQGSGQHVGRGGPAAHDLEQAHGIGGAEKVQPYYILRASHGRRDGVYIQRRGVGRQDRARLAHLFQGAEHLLLDLQLLEDSLDHQVGLGQVGVVERAEDQVHARLHLLGLQPATSNADLVITPNLCQASVQGLAIGLQQGDRYTGIGEAHGNPAAHGAGAYHSDSRDFAQR